MSSLRSFIKEIFELFYHHMQKGWLDFVREKSLQAAEAAPSAQRSLTGLTLGAPALQCTYRLLSCALPLAFANSYLLKGLIELTAGMHRIIVSGLNPKPISFLPVVFVNANFFGIPE